MRTTLTFGGVKVGTVQYARKSGWSYNTDMMYELRSYVVQANAPTSALTFTSLIAGNGGM